MSIADSGSVPIKAALEADRIISFMTGDTRLEIVRSPAKNILSWIALNLFAWDLLVLTFGCPWRYALKG